MQRAGGQRKCKDIFIRMFFKSCTRGLSLLFRTPAQRTQEKGLYRCPFAFFFPAVAFLASVFVLKCCSWGELGLCMILCVKRNHCPSMITIKSSEHLIDSVKLISIMLELIDARGWHAWTDAVAFLIRLSYYRIALFA